MATEILTTIEGRRLGLSASDELVLAPGRAFGVTATVATDGTNATLVKMQVVDRDDVAVAGVFQMDVLLSDAADGGGLTGTSASGNVEAKTNGVDLAVLVAKKATRVQTKNDGTYWLSITDTSKTHFVIAAYFRDKTIPVATLATASYG